MKYYTANMNKSKSTASENFYFLNFTNFLYNKLIENQYSIPLRNNMKSR